jgi:hypothetical protein
LPTFSASLIPWHAWRFSHPKNGGFSSYRLFLIAVKKSSIITWRHINLLGEYDYSDEKLNTITPFHLPKILELKVL